MVRNYQNAGCSLKNIVLFTIIFGTLVPIVYILIDQLTQRFDVTGDVSSSWFLLRLQYNLLEWKLFDFWR